VSGTARRDLYPALLMLVALVALPAVPGASRYVLTVAMNAAGLALVSLGVGITFRIGRINICQAGFALIGAYATAIGLSRTGLPYWVLLPSSVLVAAAVGAVIGAAVLKLRGIYFSMLTICLTEAIRLGFLNGGELTQGSRGLTGLPQPFAGDSPLPMFYLGVALLAIGFVVTWRIHYSRIGGIFHAMRLNEDLAESFGVHVWRYRIVAFAVACALGGAGGSYFAVLTQSVYPQSFTVEHSIYYMLYCFLGGLEYASGPLVGAFALVVLFELLGDLAQYQSLAYGVLMIAVMLVLPNGLLSLRLGRGRAAVPGEGRA
jgi:branched-chain amino acid transport system permease protein